MVGNPGTVIVGGSIAAMTVAGQLRQFGYEEAITVLSGERHAPYARPALSKSVLAGREAPETIGLARLARDEAVVGLGCQAVSLDTARRVVTLEDGEQVEFGSLVIATGARARRVSRSGAELSLRTVDDCLLIRERLSGCRSALVVGGGFLGMEIASTIRALGLEVTLVSRGRPLQRQLGPVLADLLEEAARDHGVKIMVADEDVDLLGAAEPEGVRFRDERRLHVYADVVITAVGCQPNVEWLAGSGLPGTEDGLVVDALCRCGPGIFAAGDVAAHAATGGGRVSRSPFWGNAIEQGRIAASVIARGAADSPSARSAPSFWTEQSGLMVRVRGRLPATGVPTIVKGSLADRSALLLFADEHGRPTTSVAINYRASASALEGLIK